MAGGTVETLVTGQSQPHSIVANATSIYWVVTGANGIWKAPLGGSAVPTQVTLFSPGQINDLAIDATSAYYTTGLGYVMSVPLAGASSAKQVTKGGSQFSQRLALDSSKVYFTETGTTIYAAPIDGGVATSIAFSSAIPQSGLALTSTDIVWGTNSATMKVALDGGAATQRAAAPAYGLASDSDEIFGFTSTGSIIKFPMSGALPTTLSFRDTTNADDIHDIAVDANAVYWTETVGNVGRVMKLSPK